MASAKTTHNPLDKPISLQTNTISDLTWTPKNPFNITLSDDQSHKQAVFQPQKNRSCSSTSVLRTECTASGLSDESDSVYETASEYGDECCQPIRRTKTAPADTSHVTFQHVPKPRFSSFSGPRVIVFPNPHLSRRMSSAGQTVQRFSSGDPCAQAEVTGQSSPNSSNPNSDLSRHDSASSLAFKRRRSLPLFKEQDTENPGFRSSTQSPASSRPGDVDIMKSPLAGPATTHTNVHVQFPFTMASFDTPLEATYPQAADCSPAVQTVRSNSGSYQVVWDEVALENGVRDRNSNVGNDTPPDMSGSASPSTDSAQSPIQKPILPFSGLDRVNTKLTAWSFTRRLSSDGERRPSVTHLIPEISVYPDTLFTSDATLITDSEDSVPIPPPNSYSSRISSTKPSRTATPPVASSGKHRAADGSLRLTIPNFSDKASTSPPEAIIIKAPRISRGSNQDVFFMGHRDSVALARERFYGGHRDSIALAKERRSRMRTKAAEV